MPRSSIAPGSIDLMPQIETAAGGIRHEHAHRAPLRPAPPVGRALATVRLHVETLGADRVLSGDIEALSAAIAAGQFDSIIPDPIP